MKIAEEEFIILERNDNKTFSQMTFGFGVVLLLSPVFFYWFIHGSYERYIRIINGPYPFSSFRSGTFQMFYLLILPVVFGGGFIFLSKAIQENNKWI